MAEDAFGAQKQYFKMMREVISVTPGYAGGKTKKSDIRKEVSKRDNGARLHLLASRLRFLWPSVKRLYYFTGFNRRTV